ncbi:LPS export ABC transporter periplasmic protein LptC [Jannaschia sp. M317]|uniref:LPS export ABC transporter periplasmic protein LptC n=1 Tax=Jannaschia sp. M317 TaxID=2867011 RepID=UPI0021A38A39|nr:LPS export ABC transporter periplasmic protein LptC [Jannaschia sp. M317]UWQ18290.1 hypothetical protein K3551_03010 [Jannaschia sp. M317]
MVADSYHTPLVRAGRVILPVTALALLSTLFLLARTVNPDDAIPFADVDVSERARDQQLTAPRFAGVSREGTEFALSANTARPDAADPRIMEADQVVLDLIDMSGGEVMVQADMGRVDTAARHITLDGNVQVTTTTGFRLTTARLEGTLGTLNIRATGGVVGDGPLGGLRADEMRVNQDEEGSQRLLFTGGVELVYTPPTD